MRKPTNKKKSRVSNCIFSYLSSGGHTNQISFRNLPTTIPSEFLEIDSITNEHLDLSDKYVKEGALTSKFHSDEQHIAISSILKTDSLVSWNFKHMENFF